MILPPREKNEGEIRVTYQKDHWVKGDLRPEHYFACTSTDADGKVTDYNKSYLDGKSEKQVIEYDVGFNQTIQVNSTADECFQHGIGRTVDDLVQAMQDVVDLENVKTKIEGLQETATGTDADPDEADGSSRKSTDSGKGQMPEDVRKQHYYVPGISG